MSSHPAHRVCLHQFQYMGKRYIARYCGGLVWRAVSFCVLFGPESVGIVLCGDRQLEFSQTAMKTVGGSLARCHETWRPRPPALLHAFWLILSQAKLLERFSSAAWCRSSFQTLPRALFSLLFLFLKLLNVKMIRMKIFKMVLLHLIVNNHHTIQIILRNISAVHVCERHCLKI